LACTLPRDSGKPLSRWSVTELVRAVVQRGIVRRISGATIQRWLKADRIKPWQYHSWQRPTDPRFLERAIPILTLYERAQTLARKGHVIVCVDEKTSIQARQACGRTTPAHPGRPMHVPDRYQRRGAVQLFAGLLVHSGETLARCFERKRFVEFQSFFQLLLGSVWCRYGSLHRTRSWRRSGPRDSAAPSPRTALDPCGPAYDRIEENRRPRPRGGGILLRNPWGKPFGKRQTGMKIARSFST
jgi:hypothetical protein